MNLSDYTKEILLSGSLDSKLMNLEPLEFDFHDGRDIPINPGRDSLISFSEEQKKFPKASSLGRPENRALALHFFANHELLAIEMMAAALYCYPTKNEEDILFKKGILSSLKDEQKHFTLYRKRMNELGVEFGDFPLNDFFWRQMKFLKSPHQFFALMSLTFEMANLDFCDYYFRIFQDIEDEKTAKILEIVLADEISHVALGRHWLETWKPTGTLWEYYKSLLPEKMSPSRAKGIVFTLDSKRKAGFEDDFLESLKSYKDDFSITKRKEWKKVGE